MIKKESPTMLVILDGFGYSKEEKGNAVKAAHMKNWNKWLKIYPHTLLNASGKAVGLLPCCLGNSEVGHTCLGSGRIVKSAATKFQESVENGTFFKNKMLLQNFEKIKKQNSSLHLMGLLSDAGVHSHQENLYALLDLACKVGIKNIFIHAFLDGRDTLPKSSKKYLKQLEEKIKEIGCGKIASLHGRFYAMDRDKNWKRVKKAYDVLCKDSDIKECGWEDAIDESYKNNITDEFFEPKLLLKEGSIKPGDGIVFFNFRPDRAMQLTQAFIDPSFSEFEAKLLNSTDGTLLFFVTSTRYKQDFAKFNNQILFEKEKIEHTLLDEIADQTPGKKVFVIAETEKYAHVTYFFRGLTEKQLPDEQYTLIPSVKVRSYVENPEMSAQIITKHLLQSLQKDPAYFYLVNYANPDMVGHSGDFDATVKACEFVDLQLEKLYEQVVEKQNGTMFIVGDHGNAEEMIDIASGERKTAHTHNPVVFMMINKSVEHAERVVDYDEPQFGLSNVAPTILKHLGLKVPKQMEQRGVF